MDRLVSTDWLAERLDQPDLHVLDATYVAAETGRDPAAEFAAGHVPGAAFLDLATLADPASALPSMLPTDAAFAERMAAAGVGDGDRIVVYDASPWRTAARAWWMLTAFGAHAVAILDGGLPKWIAEGRPLASGDAAPARRRAFHARLDRGFVRDKAEVLAAIADGGQIVDARSAARFTGEERETRPGLAAGHIPGSRGLHYARLFRSDGTYRDAAALRARFAAAGVDLARPFIATCGSGITAAVLAFAATLAGAPAAPVYDGSWTEWGGDPATPKAIGAA